MRTRHRLVVIGALALAAIGCRPKRTPAEETGDAFVDHYLKADQEGALAYSALGAATMLRKEIDDVKEARKDGAAEPHASYKRVGEETRESRTVLHYDVSLGSDGGTRELRVELADLGQGPRVVLYQLQ